MNAAALVSNVIPVDFRTAPVLTDFAVASTPKGEIALRLAAEARDQSGKLAAATDKKAGTLRLHSTPADHVLRQLLTGKALSVLEQGNAFVKLTNFGWTPAQIAAKSGLGAVRVTQILDLVAHANDAIKALVSSGRISASTAAAALREAGNDAAVAEAALTKAVKVAALAGKSKATAKHTGKLSAKASVQKWFSTATIVTDKKLTTVTVSNADWAAFAKWANLG